MDGLAVASAWVAGERYEVRFALLMSVAGAGAVLQVADSVLSGDLMVRPAVGAAAGS